MIDCIACKQRAGKIRDDLSQTDQAEGEFAAGDLIDLPADHHAGDLIAQYHAEPIGQ